MTAERRRGSLRVIPDQRPVGGEATALRAVFEFLEKREVDRAGLIERD